MTQKPRTDDLQAVQCVTGHRSEDPYSCMVNFGPVSGFSRIADELLRHFGYDPANHPNLRIELEAAIGDEAFQIGLDMLRERGLPIRDGISGEVLYA